jgi:hypothetical protein
MLYEELGIVGHSPKLRLDTHTHKKKKKVNIIGRKYSGRFFLFASANARWCRVDCSQ